ncbi:claudin-4-like [Pyrgilauda ruficollis]|uniref:claudin-4-like n=1 Tax=Pyrgilauda ruficollis TaxID=221976 RepID=UPI001B87A50B|nr:claudin-4-like [Pyrgilauda ruficollis]
MASMGMQVLGIALSVIGWLASILCCALPMWRETAFVGNNIVVAQIVWEGLWMSCVVQSTGQMQCKVYDSLLALPQDLQAARAMVVVAIVLAILGTLLAVTGGKCTNCVEDDTAKAKVMILSGIIFIVAGILILIPISWSANSIIQDFYNPLVSDSQKRDLGSSLYVGWAASVLLLLGGGILCCTFKTGDKEILSWLSAVGVLLPPEHPAEASPPRAFPGSRSPGRVCPSRWVAVSVLIGTANLFHVVTGT